MKILFINKFLRHVGGAETVFFDEMRWLEAQGHTVIPFGMAHPDNIPSPYAHHWVQQIDYARPTLQQLRDMIWSKEAARKLTGLIKETRPDIAHLHNIYHQLSPSILTPLTQAHIPTLLTAHDYKLICPNYRLYTHDGPCQRCVQSHPWHSVRHKCHKNSRPASTLVALETALHRHRRAYQPLARIIAPSHFMRHKLIQGGLPAQKVVWLPHAVETHPPHPIQPTPLAQRPPALLYAGRLEPEKGLHTLLAAAQQLPDITFLLAGTGSLADEIKQKRLANLHLLGKLAPGKLQQLRQEVRLEVIPSVWYEVFGMSAVEAMQTGLPVIASRIGGLPDVVQHEQTGLLVPPGRVSNWVQAIQHLMQDTDYAQKLGDTGRDYAHTHFHPQKHTQALLQLYREIRD